MTMVDPILALYKNSPVKFRFHILGLPHTQTNTKHLSCAYTQKLVKFMEMYKGTHHEICHYGNEGSVVPEGVKHFQILSEAERRQWFEAGPFNTAGAELRWDSNEPYWRAFGLRAASYLIQNVKPGDFILTVAGQHCYEHAVSQFPGCNKYGTSNALFCDLGSGHYGDWTDFVAYESSAHREQLHGRRKSSMESYGDAVIPNYFDLRDFRFGIDPNEQDERIRVIQQEPYYLFCGRLIDSKGWDIAVQTTQALGVRLVLCGQGNPGTLLPHCLNFGFANLEQRKSLMAGAIALLAPTKYREPFGGVNVEAQLSGTPAITSDAGGFCELVPDGYRCTTLREYIAAAQHCQTLTEEDRTVIQIRAQSKYSLEAVKPMYDRWFHRLWQLRHEGWPELRSWEELIKVAP